MNHRTSTFDDGWNGRDSQTMRCQNVQFTVEYFGYPTSMLVNEPRRSIHRRC